MSRNFFAVLDDSGDEAEVPKVSTSKKEETRPPVVENKVNAASASTRKDVAPPSTAVAVDSTSKEHRRPGHKDDRNTKGGRDRPPVREGKRQYDRRSGTGRGREIKKEGGGGRNWGNEKNVAKEAEGVVQEDEVRAEGEDIAKAEAEDIPTEGVNQEGEIAATTEPEEEEKITMTLEEYLQSKLKTDNELLKPKAARSMETSDFSGVAPKVSVQENFLVMGGGAKNSRKKEVSKEKDDEKVKLDLGFRVGGNILDRRDGDRREGRGGRSGGEDRRGGRGGRDGRGGGDRRGGGGRGRGAPVSVFDPNAFPSL